MRFLKLDGAFYFLFAVFIAIELNEAGKKEKHVM